MQQIADWLEKLGMSEYAQRFVDNAIDLSVLPDLTDQDLEKLDVLLGHRRKMLRAIKALGGAPVAEPTTAAASLTTPMPISAAVAPAKTAVNILDAVIRSRKAIRAFKSEPVPKYLLMEILDAARAAPSNFNSQPWRVYLLAGKAKDALGEAITRAHHDNTTPLFSPFPQPTPTDCAARVDEFGRRYYSALGIDRSDMTARARQTGRNYVFFGAPVGLIFTTHAALTRHSWLDCGLFLQSVMLAAQVRGLATCPQVSFVRFQSIIAEQLGLGPDEVVTCGMSCGYEDKRAAVNHLDMPREPLEVVSRSLGFEE